MRREKKHGRESGAEGNIGTERRKTGYGRRGKRRQAASLDIRGVRIAGTLKESEQGLYVSIGKNVLDDVRISAREAHISARRNRGACVGDRVIVEITHMGTSGEPSGKVIEIVAKKDVPGGDVLMLARKYGWESQFPPKVAAAAWKIRQTVEEDEMKDRVDLRQERIFTIDGANAKDFDDAVSIRRNEDGMYRLGVHIADVGHYVPEGGVLDKEAVKRGTSVYPVNQVVPMLPLPLSNGICSLKEGVDRLALTVDMLVNANGQVLEHEIYASVICSKARLIYSDVSDLLETGAGDRHGYLYDDLKLMEELANILRIKREKRGSIDFDLDEAEIILDEVGVAIDVRPAERRIANKIIEEFMLLANETVAEEYFGKGIPFVYRVHDKPEPEKLMEFKRFAESMGIKLPGNRSGMLPMDFAEIIKSIDGGPYEKIVNVVMLRTMQKAVYSTECRGHFGLSVKRYCHFTSPIRRYPDLTIHRIIKENIETRMSGERLAKLRIKTELAAQTSSETERRALELEREAEKMKKAEYMSGRIGETCEGTISGVTHFGFFVELPNTVEGLVRVDRLSDDYYCYDPSGYKLVGERTKKTYAIGDKVTVVVDSVNGERNEVNFRLADDAGGAGPAHGDGGAAASRGRPRRPRRKPSHAPLGEGGGRRPRTRGRKRR
ncbi:MAG: ribonuclease R [Clostridiales Family XIII bacterium]|jgi:ribonuclease R|nr:ribonuclease R [Clostridiales Family XIII bacterium]